LSIVERSPSVRGATPTERHGRGPISTTPRLFRATSIALLVAGLAFGLISWVSVASRRDATDAAARQSERSLVQAEQLYVFLADADATAATTFVTGGVESAARRARYVADLEAATVRLTTLSAQTGGSTAAARAVRELTESIPVYSGLVEAARANNLQGLPLGAGYLRAASSLMRTGLLAAARNLYEVEASRLEGNYAAGTSGLTRVAVVVAGLAALILLVGAQWLLTRRTNRIFNVPLLIATTAAAALLVWTVAAMGMQQSALANAARTGSDGVQVLSAARILALRDQGDESLALVSRGGGADYLADFDLVARRLGGTDGSGGLVGVDRVVADRSNAGASVDRLRGSFAGYLAAHDAVVRLQNQGLFLCADRLAVTTTAPSPGCPAVTASTTETSAAAALDAELERDIVAAQARFRSESDRAAAALNGLLVAITLLTIVISVGVLIGFQRRIEEYR
jgi:hypothetical protein